MLPSPILHAAALTVKGHRRGRHGWRVWTRPLCRIIRGARQIMAIYEPPAGQVTLIMKDGTSLAMKAGAGVKRWAPWRVR